MSNLSDMAQGEIARRTVTAKVLASKFQELKRDTFREFLLAVDEAGLDLDFITASQMFEALKQHE